MEDMNTATLPVHESKDADSGHINTRRVQRPENWPQRHQEFRELVVENKRGFGHRPWRRKVEEVMAASDFGSLFTDVLDREVLERYRAIPKQMRQIARIKSFTSLSRTINRHQGAGLTGELHEVGQGEEYQEDQKTQRNFSYTPKKFGRRVKMFWETWLDDQGVGFFGDIAQSLAEAAANTEEKRLTELFWNAAGPLEAYFNQGTHGQNGVSALAFSSANLEVAMAAMAGQTAGYRAPADINGENTPILNRPMFIVIPPVLEVTVRGALAAARLGAQSRTTNSLNEAMLAEMADLTIVVNPWLPVIVTTGTLAATTWGIFSGTIKPCELGLLQGHEEPQITIKDSNHKFIGGADVPFEMGDFDTDTMQYRIRMVQGETTLDERGGWASGGQ